MEELTFRLNNVIKSHQDIQADFEGPLDVILQLLSKNKMTIEDLSISLILEQYLEHMRGMSELDLDIASEFTVMASHLVYLKSRMLLNVGQNQEDEDMALLMRALEERKSREVYEKILIAVAFLEPLSHVGRELFPKSPEQLVKDPVYRRSHRPEELISVMAGLYERQLRRAPPERSAFSGIVGAEPYPVQKKIKELLERLGEGGKTGMKALLRGQSSRSELVATFLAVLEMCKESRIRVEIENGDAVLVLARC
jgi:segregation and condensation protein A